MNQWYVAHTNPRAEQTAQFHLRRQSFEVYLPVHLVKRSHARKTDRVLRPLFPGYLFISVDANFARWRSIRGTIGINGLICHGDTPAPVPDGIVEAIRAREDESGYVSLCRNYDFERGDFVEISDGSLAEAHGIFECQDSKDRVIVLINLLGREVRTCVPLDWIEAAA